MNGSSQLIRRIEGVVTIAQHVAGEERGRKL
jgi:hypothetical protein